MKDEIIGTAAGAVAKAALVGQVNQLQLAVQEVDGKVTAVGQQVNGLVALYSAEHAGAQDWNAGDETSFAGTITTLSVIATGDYALSERVENAEASVGETQAMVQQASQAVVDMVGRISASWSLELQIAANGQYYAAGIGIENQPDGSFQTDPVPGRSLGPDQPSERPGDHAVRDPGWADVHQPGADRHADVTVSLYSQATRMGCSSPMSDSSGTGRVAESRMDLPEGRAAWQNSLQKGENMIIGFCPLEAAWGNWADWAAVVVGLVAAVGTIWVATAAHRTALAVKNIAAEQHKEAKRTKAAMLDMVQRVLAVELAVLPGKLQGVINTLDRAAPSEEGLGIAVSDWEWIANELRQTFLPSSEESLGSLHLLEDDLGGKIADLIGFGRTVTDLAIRFDARVVRPEGATTLLLRNDGPEHFGSLRNHVNEMLRQSLVIAPHFAKVATQKTVDYGVVRAAVGSGQ